MGDGRRDAAAAVDCSRSVWRWRRAPRTCCGGFWKSGTEELERRCWPEESFMDHNITRSLSTATRRLFGRVGRGYGRLELVGWLVE